MHDCAVRCVSAYGVETQIEEVFALFSETLEFVGKRNLAHFFLARALFEVSHKFEHCHAVLDVRFFHILNLDRVLHRLSHGRGERFGFFCVLYARKQRVVGLFFVNKHFTIDCRNYAVNVAVRQYAYMIFVKYFLAFSVEFSLVDKQRRAVCGHDCVSVVDGIVPDAASAHIEQPRDVVKRRYERIFATLFFEVFLQVFNLAFYALACRVAWQKPSLRRLDFGAILPNTVDNFARVHKFDALNVFVQSLYEFNGCGRKIECDFGCIREFFHKLEN